MRTLRRITTFLVIAFVISMTLPDAWAALFHVGPVPLGAVFLAFACFTLVRHLLRDPRVLSRGAVTGFVTLLLLTVWGYLRGNIEEYSLKFFVADLFCFVAMLAGFTLADTRNAAGRVRLASMIATLTAWITVATYLAIFTGLVAPVYLSGARIFTISIFDAAGLLGILLPWASMDRSHGKKNGLRTAFLFSVLAATGLLSGTRTTVVLTVLAGCLYGILESRRTGWVFSLRLFAGVAVMLFLTLSGLPILDSFAIQRLRETDVQDESRYEELRVWWPQVSGDLLTGQGIGSRFESNVIAGDSPMASAPHIGIVTFLMKGGVFLFLAYVVFPCVLAFRIVFSARRSKEQRGPAAAVIMYVGTGLMSGGWSPLALFAYGLALGSIRATNKDPGGLPATGWIAWRAQEATDQLQEPQIVSYGGAVHRGRQAGF